jgi:hypothetical protein
MWSWQLGNMGFLQLGNVDFAIWCKMHLASNSSQFLTNFNQIQNSNVDLGKLAKVELEAHYSHGQGNGGKNLGNKLGYFPSMQGISFLICKAPFISFFAHALHTWPK